MALLHLHHANRRGFAGACGTVAMRAFGRVRAALGRIHLAIVAAKLRRLRTELMLQRDYGRPPEQDVAKYPQWPLIVPDKWDF
jgi:hypothetical protein